MYILLRPLVHLIYIGIPKISQICRMHFKAAAIYHVYVRYVEYVLFNLKSYPSGMMMNKNSEIIQYVPT